MSGEDPLLDVRGVTVEVAGRAVLHDVSLSIMPGEIHVLLGPNGSGKSSLLSAIMGLPPWEIVSGEILVGGENIAGWSIADRARHGIGLAYQRPPSLEGVSLTAFAAALGVASELEAEAGALDLAAFTGRDMNVGFSGGEIKRWEVLKLILQDPRLMLFDEPESGVDLEHVQAIGQAIRRAVSAPDSEGRARAGLVITHTGLILSHVDAARAHILSDGQLVHTGDPHAIFTHIQAHGYTVPSAA